jgi:transposase
VIGLSRAVRVWAHSAPTDLRKGYNGLFALVEQQLRKDPLSGELYLFVNRTRTSCKVLLWDGTGLCIFSKRLERGRFAKLWRDGAAAGPVVLTASELQLFIEGCVLLTTRRLSPDAVVLKPLAQARSA